MISVNGIEVVDRLGAVRELLRQQAVPEFEQAVFGHTTIGILPGLVKTRYGFHIICVDGRVPGRQVPLEAVRAQVAQRLEHSVRAKALQQYVAVLTGQADVRGVDLAAASSPLVQ